MKNINQALVKFNQHLQPIQKDGNNPFFSKAYLTLSGLLDAIRPALSSAGLSIIQPIRVDGEKNILITKVLHESGEEIVSEMHLPSLADPQKYGSLITYYKRYQLQALLGISASEEDDDANQFSRPAKQAPQQPQQTPRPATTGTPASDAQKNALKRMNIPFADGITKAEASSLIEQANKGR